MSATPVLSPVEAKAVHDLLLATHPDQQHLPCALCDDLEDPMTTETTYTEEQLQARLAEATAAAVATAVAEATGPLQAELETLRQAQAGSEVEQAVAQATAELGQQIETLTAELDTVKTEAAAQQVAHDALVAFLDEAAAEQALADRKAERVQAVKDMEFLPDALVDEQADHYGALTDEQWEAKLAELASIKDNVQPAAGSTTLPTGRTAFTATAAGGKPTDSAATRLIRRTAELQTTGSAGN